MSTKNGLILTFQKSFHSETDEEIKPLILALPLPIFLKYSTETSVAEQFNFYAAPARA
jgi:hypothetical protein